MCKKSVDSVDNSSLIRNQMRFPLMNVLPFRKTLPKKKGKRRN